MLLEWYVGDSFNFGQLYAHNGNNNCKNSWFVENIIYFLLSLYSIVGYVIIEVTLQQYFQECPKSSGYVHDGYKSNHISTAKSGSSLYA